MTAAICDDHTRPARTFGVVVHPERAPARAAARRAATWLRATSAVVVGCSQDDWTAPDVIEVVSPHEFGSDLDVVLVFGGDGTFLRAAYLARDAGVPLLGVNLGRLGFLSECEAPDVPEALERLVGGDYHIEDRMTLAVSVYDADGRQVGESWALNDASVQRRDPQRLVVLEICIGDTELTSIPADAMICASPTGSTAYAFSAGGPILSPLVEALVLTPVAPHTLFDRTMVVAPHERVTVRPAAGQSACVVSLDGRESLPVPAGGRVQVTRGAVPVRMVRLRPFDFYERVRDKFGLR